MLDTMHENGIHYVTGKFINSMLRVSIRIIVHVAGVITIILLKMTYYMLAASYVYSCENMITT